MAASDAALPANLNVDPYLEWAVATNFAYAGGDKYEWFPVLLQLSGTTSAKFTSAVSDARFRIPPVYRQDLAGSELHFLTALLRKDMLQEIVNDARSGAGPKLEWLRSLVRVELGAPVVPDFDASRMLQPIAPRGAAPAKTAIVAVIDDGIAFANARFRTADGKTRFKYFWNQDDRQARGAQTPAGFGWGRELTEREINALLDDCRYSGIVDEDRLYRLAGQTLAERRIRHGTHVADLACGLSPDEARSDSPYLIGVQLPRWATIETSGAFLHTVVLDALHYIIARADEIAANDGTVRPAIAINLSYGVIAGPHDGTATLELAIDQLIASRETPQSPIRVVMPTGNHYLAQCHARFEAGPQERELRWRVQPDNKSASFMEIWLPYEAGQTPTVKVQIVTPTGEVSPWIEAGGVWFWPVDSSLFTTRFLAVYSASAEARARILLAMAPTADDAPQPKTAPSGTWLVRVQNAGPAVAIDAWVQRGDTPFGYPLRGRQSRFDDANYVRFDSLGRLEEEDTPDGYVKRAGSINAYATGERTIVVGAYRGSDYRARRYSGAGPIVARPGAPPWRAGPDATAIGDDSVTLRGVLAAGTRTGSVSALSGTSVAAPQITRQIAKWMTDGLLPADREQVQEYARRYDPAPMERISPERGGAGRIESSPRRKERWTR